MTDFITAITSRSMFLVSFDWKPSYLTALHLSSRPSLNPSKPLFDVSATPMKTPSFDNLPNLA